VPSGPTTATALAAVLETVAALPIVVGLTSNVTPLV
jgi:hypothetical protein